MGKLFWSILCPSQCLSPFCSCSLFLLSLLPCLLILEPIPLTSHFYLFSSSGEKGKKRMRDWKFVEKSFWRTFLDYVHKAQAAHSVNMARCQWDLFPWRLFLYSNNQGADRGKKRVFLPIRYTLCNILAVHTNKAMREKIMTRYQPSSGVANSHSSLTKCPVELSSVSAPNLRLRTSSDRMLSTAQCCGKCNIWWLPEIQHVGQVRCCSEWHFWDAS